MKDKVNKIRSNRERYNAAAGTYDLHRQAVVRAELEMVAAEKRMSESMNDLLRECARNDQEVVVVVDDISIVQLWHRDSEGELVQIIRVVPAFHAADPCERGKDE